MSLARLLDHCSPRQAASLGKQTETEQTTRLGSYCYVNYMGPFHPHSHTTLSGFLCQMKWNQCGLSIAGNSKPDHEKLHNDTTKCQNLFPHLLSTEMIVKRFFTTSEYSVAALLPIVHVLQ